MDDIGYTISYLDSLPLVPAEIFVPGEGVGWASFKKAPPVRTNTIPPPT